LVPQRPTELPLWLAEPGPCADRSAALPSLPMPGPPRYQIENVEHRRPDSGAPMEAAAIRMILEFHRLAYDEGLPDRLAARKPYPERFIRPRDLANALTGLPVETGVVVSWDP